MMELLMSPDAWIAFVTLTLLELVLGIDNIVFISILADKLPPEKRERARKIGLALAMIMRIGLLSVLTVIIGLVEPLFTVFAQEISGRDLILICGGLFLLYKSTHEIPVVRRGRRRYVRESEFDVLWCAYPDHHHRYGVLNRFDRYRYRNR